MNLTDQFDTRLAAMQSSQSTPDREITCAIAIYERLRTAQAISAALLGSADTAEAQLAILSELCLEARRSQGAGEAA